ncbi:hypothetical protein EDC03_3162 [Pseudokineococcus lusitanus]|uniref:Uncharacterized protein n=1 Tax=Pseudokineococcus lusitanus TaxID=763993 RepID=A0A3N1G9K8_9ACTN|nr:hypothetical protein EDC03_3162 [Pseudokineococcus lusitanus]
MKEWGVFWVVARVVTVLAFVTWLLVAAPE